MAMRDFGTPTVHIRAGFDRIASGLTLPWGARRSLYRRFHEAHSSGDPRQEQNAISDTLAGKSWTWPWWEDCASTMRSNSVWPRTWTERAIDKNTQWQGIAEGAKFDLLKFSMGAAVYLERDVASFKETRDALPYGVELCVGDHRCKAEEYFVSIYKEAVAAWEFANRPPFFPGDGSLIRLEQTRRSI